MPTRTTETPPMLWQPHTGESQTSRIADFARWVREHRAATEIRELDYSALHGWSVRDLDGFWSAVADYFAVRFHEQPSAALGDRAMPGTDWFPGATLNYAEHALSGPGRADDDLAVIAITEGTPDPHETNLSYGELRDLVARAQAGLVANGVQPGDRIVAVLPNCIEALVGFLAAASLGATWSCCSPDFGAKAVLDRFNQLEPTVLITVDGYHYGGKQFDLSERVTNLNTALPSLRTTVVVPRLHPGSVPDMAISWSQFTSQPGDLNFTPVSFDHPLWVLYSSGTTGLPKGIVQSHGGIVLEHLKALGLQHDLGPGDRFMWYTTTGWMMWNYLVGGLLVGAVVILYDGSPTFPDVEVLWSAAERHDVVLLGVSAQYLQAVQKAGFEPRNTFDLPNLRALGSTGSPLSPDQFTWLTDALGPDVQICSVSGGTDMCTAFLTSAPTVPVWVGELSCAALGADVHALDDDGADVVDGIGELVITQPMPSMPVSLWGDEDGSRLHDSYFALYPGLWRHGDWVRATSRGSFVIAGRSDSTLNRGGIRIGTADLYAVIESFDEVRDSLVIDTSGSATTSLADGLVCFLVLKSGFQLDQVEPRLRNTLRSELSPRHVPDEFLAIGAIPRTLNGKKCEVPIKRIIAGAEPDKVISRDALNNPESLDYFTALAQG